MTPSKPAVMLVTGAYFPEMSGAGLQCREIVRQLRDDVNFTVLTTTTDRKLPAGDEVDGIPVDRVFVDPASVWSKLATGFKMMSVLLRERRNFAVIHLHGFSQKSILLMAFGFLTRKKIAVTFHSVGHDDPISMKRAGRVAYWWYKKAHIFSGVSPAFARKYDASDLPRNRFRLIENGVDVKRFRPAAGDELRALRDELALPRDAKVILFVGFFSHEKCPDVLFDAWARVASLAGASSVLVFVGATRSSYYEVDRSLADGIRSRAREEGLTDRVYFVDPTPDVERYHRAADIFVLPSVREGLPCALQESMAAGKACVATRLEGVTDALIEDGESGILFAPRDAKALAAALGRLLTEGDLAQALGARARERMVRDFAIEDTARKYQTLYDELLHER